MQPRLGVVYDVFGDGKTAIKASANRYGNPEGVAFASAINPASNNNEVNRTWFDGATGVPQLGIPSGALPSCIGPVECVAGDGFPQGDPANPLPNGELVGFSNNPAFGQAVITEFYDPEWAFGWGKRFANWEFSGGIQHEVLPGVSVDVGYFRRVFINFETVNDRALGAEDFDEYSVTAPTDPRLPGGGGYVIDGLVDQNPATVGRLRDEITTSADNFGGRSRSWHGVDLGVNARIENVLLQGGLSTGKTTEDDCALIGNLPERLISGGDRTPAAFCSTTTPFLTQVKFLGSYTLPYEIQIAATFQNIPGPERDAEVVFSSAQIAQSLGRGLSTSSNVTIDVLEPGSTYGERLNQLDLRLTKILSFGGTRLQAMFDMYNLLNANAVLRENPSFDANWLNPVAVLPGRLMKFAFQFDF